MTTTPLLLDCLETETGPQPQRSVIWLHGLGADANDFFPIVPQLDLRGLPPVRFVFPNAPVRPVTINMNMPMRAWYDILGTDLSRREDEAGLRESQAAIETLITREIERGTPSEHIVLAGFSQGCAVILQTGLRQPRRLAGLMGLSGYLPLASHTAAERHPANQDTPIFLAHGTQDPVVIPARAEASRDLLTSLDYDVRWHTYPMPHSVHPAEITDISLFLQDVLR